MRWPADECLRFLGFRERETAARVALKAPLRPFQGRESLLACTFQFPGVRQGYFTTPPTQSSSSASPHTTPTTPLVWRSCCPGRACVLPLSNLWRGWVMLESCRALLNTKVETHHGPCGNSGRDVTERPGLSRVRLFGKLSRRRCGRHCELCLYHCLFSKHC